MFSRRPDYLLKVKGMSMRDAGIIDGDLLAVQKSREARNGQIVVARLDDTFTVKRWRRRGQRQFLVPENPEYEAIEITGDRSFEIWGVVTYAIHALGSSGGGRNGSVSALECHF